MPCARDSQPPQLRYHEIMHANLLRIPFRPPLPPFVLEIAHQFLLLGVHRYHRLTDSDVAPGFVIDVLELGIAVRMGVSLLGLAVGLQAVPHAHGAAPRPLDNSPHVSCPSLRRIRRDGSAVREAGARKPSTRILLWKPIWKSWWSLPPADTRKPVCAGRANSVRKLAEDLNRIAVPGGLSGATRPWPGIPRRCHPAPTPCSPRRPTSGGISRPAPPPAT